MILHGVDNTWVIWPVSNRGLENDALVVALALALGLDAVGASRSFFATLDAAFAACEAARLGSLSHLGI